MDRIKFAIKHFRAVRQALRGGLREAGLQLLDALERLEELDRRFQVRFRVAPSHRNGSERSVMASATAPG